MASVKRFHIAGDYVHNGKSIGVVDLYQVERLIYDLLTPWEDDVAILTRLANLEVGEYLSTTHIRAIIRLKDR